MNNKNIEQNSFVAISDFHSYRYPLEIIKNKYLKEYDKIFILGDATDRGEDNKGTHGIKVLEEIMKLSRKYPEKVFYIPGDHDELLYNRAYSGGQSRYQLKLYENGGENTAKEISHMLRHESRRAGTLLNWLGKQPLQREHYYNGQRYVFAHAFFNQKVFEENPDFSLKNLHEYSFAKESDSFFGVYTYPFKDKEYNKLGNIIHYRKLDYNYNLEEISIDEVPTDAIMVIGHTPLTVRRGEFINSIRNKNGKLTEIYCVDGGISYGGKMLQYDGKGEVIKVKNTTFANENEEMTNQQRKEILNIMNDVFIETASNRDVHQAKYALKELVNDSRKWALYVSRDNFERINNLGAEAIKKTVLTFSGKEKDLNVGIDKYFNVLFDEPEDNNQQSLSTNQKSSMVNQKEFIKKK